MTWELPDVKSGHNEPGEDNEVGGCPGVEKEASHHNERGAQHGTEVFPQAGRGEELVLVGIEGEIDTDKQTVDHKQRNNQQLVEL